MDTNYFQVLYDDSINYNSKYLYQLNYFQSGKADFSGINGVKSLYLSDVIQLTEFHSCRLDSTPSSIFNKKKKSLKRFILNEEMLENIGNSNIDKESYLLNHRLDDIGPIPESMPIEELISKLSKKPNSKSIVAPPTQFFYEPNQFSNLPKFLMSGQYYTNSQEKDTFIRNKKPPPKTEKEPLWLFYNHNFQPESSESDIRKLYRQEIPNLAYDRAFFYTVRHNPTGLLLFMGRYLDPDSY